MIILQVDGKDFTGFDDIEVTQALDTVSGTFRFTAFTDSTSPFPIQMGAECRVLVDDAPIITGFVEVLEVLYDNETHAITIQGRDKTADVIDSTLGDGIDFIPPISLKALIEMVLTDAGINGISVVDEVGDLEPFSASDKISAEVGLPVFDLIEGYARKRQVLLTSNGNGDIVITRGQSEDVGFTLFNQLATPSSNNIKSAQITYNNSDRFNRYIVKSQLNSSGLNIGGLTDPSTIVDSNGEATDTDIRSSRTLYLVAEKSTDANGAQQRAVWQANINRSRSFNYEAVVQGHVNEATGKTWEVNKLVSVEDEFAGLSGKFLINSVTYRQSNSQGSTSVLGIIAKDAYTLQASEPQAQKETNKQLLI